MQLYNDFIFKQCFTNKTQDKLFFVLEYIDNDIIKSVVCQVRSNNIVNDLAKYRKEFNPYDKVNCELDINFDQFKTYVNLVAIKKI